tara:strand:+ start:575 stop:856 length:282 start_codon:yes stop_codon:yes gene_type:complete
MSKKEKVIDLKPKAEKVSEEQLLRLQQAVSNTNSAQFEIGKIETRKHILLHEHALLQDVIVKLQNELTEEYGTFDVNLQNGIINYAKDEEPRN